MARSARTPVSALLFGTVLVVFGALSARAGLLRDVDTGFPLSLETGFADLGGVAIFGARDAAHGWEVWRSDGTPAGTLLVSDINPGACDSNASNFVTAGSVVFFFADDGVVGKELWKTDGTASGTVLVKDIIPGSADSGFLGTVGAAGNRLVFQTVGLGNLWGSDGTGAGTVLLPCFWPADLIESVGNVAYFSSGSFGVSNELWITDGTPAGTRGIAQVGSSISEIEPAGAFIYLATQWAGLWRSDGTVAGTFAISNVLPTNLRGVGDRLFFSGDAGSDAGGELWTYVPGAGASLVLDINTNFRAGSEPSDLTDVGGRLFFSATDGGFPSSTRAGRELWSSDGTAAGTMRVADIFPGMFDSSPDGLTAVGPLVFFAADSWPGSTELWTSDGSAAGTTLVRDIHPTSSSDPLLITNVGGRLFFSADDGSGRLVWTSDGSEAGTIPLPTGQAGEAASDPGPFARAGSKMLFAAADADHGRELWRTDGTPAGTTLVADILPRGSSSPAEFVEFEGATYFVATGPVVSPLGGRELWRTAGTVASTALVHDMNRWWDGSDPADLTVVGNGLFFSALGSRAYSRELWKTDGTDGGTMLVRGDLGEWQTAYPTEFTEMGGILYFVGHDDPNGVELWRSDGTFSGTQMVLDINPAVAWASPNGLGVIAGSLFFAANDGTTGSEPWLSDGSAAGTRLLVDINAGGDSDPGEFTDLAGRAIFHADDGLAGDELWVSDGSAVGTVLVADIAVGGSSTPRDLAAAGGQVFFTADDGVLGRELWTTDGTAAGTRLVADLRPGAGGSDPTLLTPQANSVYFAADDGVSGRALWRSDGTAAGTQIVLAFSADPCMTIDHIAIVGTEVILAASDGVSGVEPWVTGPLDLPPTSQLLVTQRVSSLATAFAEMRTRGVFTALANVTRCGLTRLDPDRALDIVPADLDAGLVVAHVTGPLVLFEVSEWCACSADSPEPPPGGAADVDGYIVVGASGPDVVVRRLAGTAGSDCP